MLDVGYLFAKDNKRLFINPTLGCNARCSYCYLPKLGIDEGIDKVLTLDEILALLVSSGYQYDQDTIITLGCFSECFDDLCKDETVKIIEYFLSKGNQVQVSTKKKVDDDILLRLASLQKYYGQLVVFVSNATISRHDSIEINTDLPGVRFENFRYLGHMPIVLYLKPVLKDVTICDIDEYLDYIKMYNIEDIVVGSIFSENKSSTTVPFSNANELFYKSIADEDILVQEFSKYANVFRRSTQVLKKYK